jgi:hypothetical protein
VPGSAVDEYTGPVLLLLLLRVVVLMMMMLLFLLYLMVMQPLLRRLRTSFNRRTAWLGCKDDRGRCKELKGGE